MIDTTVESADWRALAAAIALGTIGALTIMIAPGFVALVADQAHVNDQHLGYVVSWDIDSMAASIALTTFLIARVNWRHLALLGLGFIAAGSLWTATAQSYEVMIASRVCVGVGEGLAVGVSFAALGRARNADQAFGLYLVVGFVISAG
ncbi:MAG: MFS transporter, partial [Steroidobacteraceae bacterium]